MALLLSIRKLLLKFTTFETIWILICIRKKIGACMEQWVFTVLTVELNTLNLEVTNFGTLS